MVKMLLLCPFCKHHPTKTRTPHNAHAKHTKNWGQARRGEKNDESACVAVCHECKSTNGTDTTPPRPQRKKTKTAPGNSAFQLVTRRLCSSCARFMNLRGCPPQASEEVQGEAAEETANQQRLRIRPTQERRQQQENPRPKCIK